MWREKKWEDIHPDFAKKGSDGRTYQQIWEENNLAYQVAQEWIKIGFKPSDYKEVKQWRNLDFAPQSVKPWKNISLKLTYDSSSHAELAAYLKRKGYQPGSDLNWKQIKENGIPAQEYLDIMYPQEQRKEITELYISSKNLQETLDLNDFVNLEKLDCHKNKLTNLKLDNCLKLKELNCSENYLSSLKLPSSAEYLTELNIRNNDFSEQDLSMFSPLINLIMLWVNDNFFYGSLKPLQNLTKLKELNISNTDIDSGLEYLPESIKRFYCSTNEERKDAKVKAIERELRHFNNNLKKCQEFNDTAQKWLISKGYYRIERKKIQKLDIKIEEGEEKLKGGLWLKGFINLQYLDCSGHQLTDLDLSDCPGLTELKCDNNEFKDLNFLQPLKKLKNLWIQNNRNLSRQDLSAFASFKELQSLDISNCPFESGFKPLKNLNNLETLIVSNTNLSEGLEYLPESCDKLFCNSVYPHQSIKLMEELEKSKCFKEISSEEYEKENQAFREIFDIHHKKYYNPARWRTDQANHKTASVVPLERLFVIRNNLKQFINKWKKEPEEKDWFEKQFLSRSQAPNFNKLDELQSPEQFNKHWRWTVLQYGSQATTIVGGGLTLLGKATDHGGITILGGIMSSISPIVNVAATKLKNNFYDFK